MFRGVLSSCVLATDGIIPLLTIPGPFVSIAVHLAKQKHAWCEIVSYINTNTSITGINLPTGFFQDEFSLLSSVFSKRYVVAASLYLSVFHCPFAG